MSKSPAVRFVLLHAKSLHAEGWEDVRSVLGALASQSVATAGTPHFVQMAKAAGAAALPNVPESWSPGSDRKPDMVLSFGGDGTVLETASLEGVQAIPVLGINTGRLGFLSHLAADGAAEAIRNIVAGEYTVESRNMLEVDFPGRSFEQGGLALNEVTVHRRDVASMIRISVHRNGVFVNRYWADGLIVSTATGSTAYSLSCGGPIVHPDSNAIVLNPIAPHNLHDRPLVIPADGTLDIQAEGRDDHLMLTMDTRSHKVDAPARFSVRQSEQPFLLVQLPGVDFIETVRRKLHLGLDGREGPSGSAEQENHAGLR